LSTALSTFLTPQEADERPIAPQRKRRRTTAQTSSDQAPEVLSVSIVGGESEKTWKDCIEEISRMRNLKDDWDGEGTTAPLPELLDGIIILFQMPEFRQIIRTAPTYVVPISDGRISIDWYFGTAHLNARVDSPTRARCMYVAQNGRIEFCSWDWSSEPPTVTWTK
jgi:hypothetical protein